MAGHWPFTNAYGVQITANRILTLPMNFYTDTYIEVYALPYLIVTQTSVVKTTGEPSEPQ